MDFLSPLLEKLGFWGVEEALNNQVALLVIGLNLILSQREVSVLHGASKSSKLLGGQLFFFFVG